MSHLFQFKKGMHIEPDTQIKHSRGSMRLTVLFLLKHAVHVNFAQRMCLRETFGCGHCKKNSSDDWTLLLQKICGSHKKIKKSQLGVISDFYEVA